MPTSVFRLLLLLTVMLTVGTAPIAQAAVIITLGASGGDVVANASGSLDLSGLRFVEAASYPLAVYPAVGAITLGPYWDSVENYDGLTAWPTSFGPGGNTTPDSSSGFFFAVGENTFAIERFYANFSPISGSSTWRNTSLEQLGVTPGSYTWTWTADSITLNVVPEPSSYAIMVLAGLVVGRGSNSRCRDSVLRWCRSASEKPARSRWW